MPPLTNFLLTFTNILKNLTLSVPQTHLHAQENVNDP
jgi:hypothetical protein